MTLGAIEEYFARLETLHYLLDWNTDEVSDEAIFEIFLVPVAVLPDKKKNKFYCQYDQFLPCMDPESKSCVFFLEEEFQNRSMKLGFISVADIFGIRKINTPHLQRRQDK